MIIGKIDCLDARVGEVLRTLGLHCKDELLFFVRFAVRDRHLAVDQSQIVVRKDILAVLERIIPPFLDYSIEMIISPRIRTERAVTRE